MEKLKKKRSEVREDGRSSGKKLKSNGGATADEAELEEFNAILQRLRAGINRFNGKGVGESAGKTAVTPPATEAPAFELGDFDQFHGGDGRKSDGVVGIDLNVDPVSDQKSD